MAELQQKRCRIVCPNATELSSICIDVKCPEDGCDSIFHSSSNLNMHLIKHHKIESTGLNKKEEDCRYHCPVFSCPYAVKSFKFFKKLKYLKQHYLKVHAEKKIMCDKCKKCFSTASAVKSHGENCGMVYVCSCGWTYSTNEAILTHCRRRGHTILNKIKPTDKQNDLAHSETSVTEKDSVTLQNISKKMERPIYPKLSVPYIAAVALIELSSTSISSKAVDKEVQTDTVDVEIHKGGKKYWSNLKNDRKRKNSQQTQTGAVSSRCKKLKISAETQTNTDYTKQLKNKNQHKNTPRKRKKSMETQTNKHVKKEEQTSKKHDKTSSGKKNCVKLTTYSIVKKPTEQKKYIEQASTAYVHELNIKPQTLGNYIHNTDTSIKKLEDQLFEDSSNSSSELRTTINPVNVIKTPTKYETIKADINLLNTIEDEDTIRNWCFEQTQNPFKKELRETNCRQSFITTLNSNTFHENQELNLFDSKNQNINYKKSDTALFVDSALDQNCETNVFDINKFSNIETQTELDTFLNECDEDTSFTLCSTTETQTTDDFDPLLYSHMCTQTCEEVDTLFNFNFVDIETQTAWPDLDECEYLSS